MNQARKAEAKSNGQHAEGTLGATPLAHLLVFAQQRGLTGRLTLERHEESVEIQFVRGLVRAAQTTTPIAYLGNVLYELGFVDGQGLSATLAQLAAQRGVDQASIPADAHRVRHGELLVRGGFIDASELAEGLRHQLERKLVHAFSFTDDAHFVFRPESEPAPDHDAAHADDAHADADPFALAWAGLRIHGSESRARSVLARLGSGKLMLTATGRADLDLERYGFNIEERVAAARFTEASALGPRRLDVLVAYALAITKALGPAPAPASAHASATVIRPAAPPSPSSPASARALEPRRFTTPPIGSVRVPAQLAQSAVRSHPQVSDPRVNFQNAEIALAEHDLDLAETLCKKAHEEEPRHAEYLALLAWLRTFRDDGATPGAIEEALEMLERALDLHPGCERAYLYRAQIRKAAGDAVGSISDFRSAHTLNPNNVEAARELRIHEMRAKNAASERRSSGLFQRILGKK